MSNFELKRNQELNPNVVKLQCELDTIIVFHKCFHSIVQLHQLLRQFHSHPFQIPLWENNGVNFCNFCCLCFLRQFLQPQCFRISFFLMAFRIVHYKFSKVKSHAFYKYIIAEINQILFCVNVLRGRYLQISVALSEILNFTR